MLRLLIARVQRASRALLVAAIGIAALVASHAIAPAPAAAQAGCCFCFNCTLPVTPFCTDLMPSSASCLTKCQDSACTAHTFSSVQTCGGGCGGFDPYFSPTPTPTATATITTTPTITPTPSITPTPPATPTPFLCCQCPQNAVGTPTTCGERPRTDSCPSDCDEFEYHECQGDTGSCLLQTPTRTFTPTLPTATPTPSPTLTPTNTQTATTTPTRTLGGFVVDPYHCYRAKGASAGKGLLVDVDDAYGSRMKKVIKPFFECSPSNVSIDTTNAINNPNEHLTCYKAKDLSRPTLPDPVVRNAIEEDLTLDLIKGDLICLPSLVSGLPMLPPPPTVTPTSTPP